MTEKFSSGKIHGPLWRDYEGKLLSDKIWPFGPGESRVHCNAGEYRLVMALTGSEHGSTYTIPDGPKRYDVTIQNSELVRARRILGSNPKKCQNGDVV